MQDCPLEIALKQQLNILPDSLSSLHAVLQKLKGELHSRQKNNKELESYVSLFDVNTL